MPLHIPNNLREPGSRITDSTILHKGDELKIYAKLFVARLAILDSHDPKEELPHLAHKPGILSNHHHILLAPDPEDETGLPDVFPAGLTVGTGGVGDLFMYHYALRWEDDAPYMNNLGKLMLLGAAGFDGMFFASDSETLSTRTEAQPYLDEQRNLLV